MRNCAIIHPLHLELETALIISMMLSVVLILTIASDVMAELVDLRTSTDISGTYEVGFCARPSPDTVKHLPGHAFVSFSYSPYHGQRTFLAIGHTVLEGNSASRALWSYFGSSVTGYLKEEVYTSRMERCLQVKVNEADYEAAYALTANALSLMGIEAPKEMPVFEAYKLGDMDCMHFLIRVAEIIRPRSLSDIEGSEP
ncbi:MAG: hypothetical protein HY348_03130 [Nitrospira defluvii]|nr:hypothetical protein [Nitrospira defluvii]